MRKKRNTYYKKRDNFKKTITKRYNILVGFIIAIMLIMTLDLFYIQIVNYDYYQTKVKLLNRNITYGSSAPRGRIYDRQHRVIVDNKAVKVISYKRESDITSKDEIELAYKIGGMIEVDFEQLSITKLKEFWIKNFPDKAREKITEEEWKQLEERKLTIDDIEKMKIDRVNEEDLEIYSAVDKEAAYIYYLMNKGYYYNEKIIKKENVTDQEYANVSENLGELKGFNTKLDWERIYPYGSVFRVLLGNVSTNETGIPYELKDYYLNNGYSLNDRVGTSYLEYQYESYLKGVKNKYEIVSSGENILLENGTRGNDIVLSIDIELQKAVEEIIIEELIYTKKEPNTEYYNRSFVVITNPNTGEILAMAGKQIVMKQDGDYTIYDYTPGIVTSPVVPGSIVKGASHIVGYNTGALKIGEIRDDNCIKIASTPLKCSWTNLGRLNDIGALKRSSNVYQFKTAINVGKGNYVYNKPLAIDPNAFSIYRNIFKEFGLGVKTGIDLPIESEGYKGSGTGSGQLLDFAIGQYDNYTPIQLAQYIGTIATNGLRIKPHILKQVYAPTKEPLTNLIYEEPTTILNKVNTEDKYLERVREGFKQVTTPTGTGYGYIPYEQNPAGKTGTSESFIDTDNDGLVDKETLSNTFGGYAPYDNPTVLFTVVSPDVGHEYNQSNYKTVVNRRISYKVSKKYFEIYK